MEQEGSAAAETAQEVEKLEKTLRSGANWFYWIAGLSVVNSAIQLLGSDTGFIIGLGVTQVVDGFAKAGADHAGGGAGVVVRAIAFVIDLVVAGFFALLAWQAGKKRSWAFILGMLLYALDALIFLLIRDWLSIGFHAFALFGLWTGYSSLRRMRAGEQRLGVRPIGPGAA